MKMLIGCFGLAFILLAGCDDGREGSSQTDADNTAVNERDADGNTMTPFEQSNSTADTELVAKLRSEVLEIEDLSINGRNIKIITNDGKVFLRGPVQSTGEHMAIVKVVNDIAGESNVTDQLEVIED